MIDCSLQKSDHGNSLILSKVKCQYLVLNASYYNNIRDEISATRYYYYFKTKKVNF